MTDVNVLFLKCDRVKLKVAQIRTRLRRVIVNPMLTSIPELLVLSQNLDGFYEEYNEAYDGILQSCEPAERVALDEEYVEFEQLFYETCVSIERLKEDMVTDATLQPTSPQKTKRKKPASSPLPLLDSKVCAIPKLILNPPNAATNDPMDSPPSPSDDEGSQCPDRTIVDCAGHIPEVLVDQLRSNSCQTVVPHNNKPLKRKPSPLPTQSKYADGQTRIAAALQQPSAVQELTEPNAYDLNSAGLPISNQAHRSMNGFTPSPEVSSSISGVQTETARLVVLPPSDMPGSNLWKIRSASTERRPPRLGTGSEGDVASKPQLQASTEESELATSGRRPDYESRFESAVPQLYPPKTTLAIQFVEDGQEKYPVTAVLPESLMHPTIQKPSNMTPVPDCLVETTPKINQEDERAIQMRTEAINLVMVPFQKRNPVPEYTPPFLKQKKPPDIIHATVGPENETSPNQYQNRNTSVPNNERQESKKLRRPREAKWRFPPPRAPDQSSRRNHSAVPRKVLALKIVPISNIVLKPSSPQRGENVRPLAGKKPGLPNRNLTPT